MQRKFINIPWFTRRGLVARSQKIVATLTRHGLGWLFAQLEGEASNRRGFGSGGAAARQKQAVELRLAMEELGATFIKLGQALSSRPDLLPMETVMELSKLQDEVPPMEFDLIRPVIETELGGEIQQFYTDFDPTPIASASIGQVYAARLKTGQAVVVKVVRPGVEQLVQQDLEILTDMASWMAIHTELGEMYDLPALMDEFAYRLRSELDYKREGHNADQFRENFYGDPRVYVPRVYWELTTSRVITMERVYGIKLNDAEALDRAGINRRVVAENSAHIIVRGVFEHGYFHPDPHPGNFFVQPDGSLAVIDFGMMGRFSPHMRECILRMGLAVVRADPDGLVDELLDAGMTGRKVKLVHLRQDVAHILERYAGCTFEELTATQVLSDVMDMAMRNGLQLPSEMAILGRLIAIGEGIAVMLCPGFRMLEFAEPYVKRFYAEKRSPGNLAPELFRSTQEMLEFILRLPRQASRLLGQLERGQLEFNINYDGLREFTRKMQGMTNRLAISAILAAVIIALGLTTVVYHPAEWQKFGEYLFAFAFISSLVMGAILMFTIWRSGRGK